MVIFNSYATNYQRVVSIIRNISWLLGWSSPHVTKSPSKIFRFSSGEPLSTGRPLVRWCSHEFTMTGTWCVNMLVLLKSDMYIYIYVLHIYICIYTISIYICIQYIHSVYTYKYMCMYVYVYVHVLYMDVVQYVPVPMSIYWIRDGMNINGLIG